ncbi:MAG: DUF4830 domain-containing protein [Oscillospiraceae bacterium]|nr:DUF4830 domain-containing protein [Oscillospiraceae bacterium]
MIVMSFRLGKKRALCLIGFFLFVLAAILFGGRLIGAAQQTASQSKIKSEKIAGGTESQRQEFIASFGWEIETEPSLVMEVKIPETFDAVYEEYNNLQKTQGMDLSGFKGKRCKKYQYAVLNYPNQPEHVACTLLVRDGKIIGGDVSCGGENGFSHGFALPS